MFWRQRWTLRQLHGLLQSYAWLMLKLWSGIESRDISPRTWRMRRSALVVTLLRLAVKAVPRGSSGGGDAIRHGILNIMRTHGIKEGHRPGIECKFIEQWHQKLHTNSAPDDIAICYLAYLSSGNVDEMYRVMWECGKLTREDLGKMCQMGFKDHTKSGGRGLNFTPAPR
eukprot:g27365.t1